LKQKILKLAKSDLFEARTFSNVDH